MNKVINLHGFEFLISPSEVQIKKADTSLSIRPGDVPVLQESLALIGSFKNLENKPESINFIPFVFSLSDDIKIKKTDDKSLSIEWNDIEDLITSLESVLSAVKDERKLRPGTRSGGWNPPDKGIVIG